MLCRSTGRSCLVGCLQPLSDTCRAIGGLWWSCTGASSSSGPLRGCLMTRSYSLPRRQGNSSARRAIHSFGHYCLSPLSPTTLSVSFAFHNIIFGDPLFSLWRRLSCPPFPHSMHLIFCVRPPLTLCLLSCAPFPCVFAPACSLQPSIKQVYTCLTVFSLGQSHARSSLCHCRALPLLPGVIISLPILPTPYSSFAPRSLLFSVASESGPKSFRCCMHVVCHSYRASFAPSPPFRAWRVKMRAHTRAPAVPAVLLLACRRATHQKASLYTHLMEQMYIPRQGNLEKCAMWLSSASV
ncbi:hypothetical protein BKA62DRAFT_287141 [Auriculariales sp. MPI-PUGE-AT-0066]|nr:hypothetical protein BKA62DRAFT_287141 [Auriculariales sp. MPI-PUGE-AT-0066]